MSVITNESKAREVSARIAAWRALHPIERARCKRCSCCGTRLGPQEPIVMGSYARFGMFGVWHWCACNTCMGLWPEKVTKAVQEKALYQVLTNHDYPLLGYA